MSIDLNDRGMTMHVNESLLLILALALGSNVATAQSLRPGPEIQKLGYYLGTWQGHGESKGGPFGPAGKLSSTTTCEWFTGGFQLVCRGEESGPTGKRSFLNIRSFDAVTRTYTEYGISNFGESEYTTGGIIVDNKKTFVVNIQMSGKPVRIRYTEVRLSPTLFSYRTESSIDGGPWTAFAEGQVRKVK